MKRHLFLAGLTVLASIPALLICCLGIWMFVGAQGIFPAVAASIVSLAVGLVTIFFIQMGGFSAAVLVFAPLLRVSLTLGLGAAVAKSFQIWNLPFFITLGVIYLANLVVETWLVYEQNRKTSAVKVSKVS